MTRPELLRWFILAFGFRLACYAGSDAARVLALQLTNDRWEDVEMANGMLAGYGFAGVVPEHRELPSAWCPPGYILLLAALKGVTRDATVPMVCSLFLMNGALDGLTTALVARLGMALGGRMVGACAGVLHLLSPKLVRYGYWAWDTPFGDLAVVLLLGGTVLRRDPPTRREDVLAGAGLCLAGMFSGPALFVGPTILLGRLLRAPRPRDAVASCLVVGSSFLACQAPWVARNYFVLGAPVLTRPTYPIAAHMANVPGPGMLHSVVLNGIAHEGARYVRLGEIGYQRLCRELFWEDVHTYPRDYAIRSVYRLFQLWLGRSSASCAGGLLARAIGSEQIRYADVPLFPLPAIEERIGERYALVVVALALAGVVGMARIGRGREALLLSSVLVFTSIVYIPCHVEDRFRSPFDSILALLAAHGLTLLTGTYRWGVSAPYPRAVERAWGALRAFLTPRPRGAATVWGACGRAALTALVAPALFVPPIALGTSLINRSSAPWNFLLDASLVVALATFFADLIRRYVGSRSVGSTRAERPAGGA